MSEQLGWDSMAQPGLRPGRYLSLQERFEEWLATADGQATYRLVVERALALRRIGFAHYSMKALWEVIRFDRAIAAGSASRWKMNNDYTSRMARRVMTEYPDLVGFFEVRETKA